MTQLQLMGGGFYLARSLQIVAELGVADHLGHHALSGADLAALTHTHPDALTRVLALLSTHNVFQHSQGKFRHSELSRLLTSDHPTSMRPFLRMFGMPIFWQAAMRMNETIATGLPDGDSVFPGGFWAYLQQHPEDNTRFNTCMQSKASMMINLVPRAYDFSRFPVIADVGGGRGHLLEAILQQAPASQGILFDQPHVVAEATHIAGERLELRPGDFFHSDLPRADAYVLMEIIHDWDDSHSRQILSAVRRAAPVGSKLLLVEAMMPDPPVPCWTATMDILMLHLLGGSQRSFAGYVALLEHSGFNGVREIPVGAGHSIIEATAA